MRWSIWFGLVKTPRRVAGSRSVLGELKQTYHGDASKENGCDANER